MKRIFIFSILALLTFSVLGQDRFENITKKLEELSASQEGLNNTVELSVSNASLADFVRGIGIENKLNVSIDANISYLVSNNFSNATVKDIFVFICRKHKLDIEFIGSIISFKKFVKPEIIQLIVKKKPKVNFIKKTDFLSLDLKRDTIDDVVQEITSQSLHNVIIEPDVSGKKVSVYIQNRPFESALDKLALSNGLILTKTADNFYVLGLDKEKKATTSSATNNRNNRNSPKEQNDNTLFVEVRDNRFITLRADQVPINELIDRVSQDLVENYFMYDVPKSPTSVFIENATYEEFLTYVLKGTGHVHAIQNDVYLIGKRESEVFRQTKLLKFENRRVESILASIPANIKGGLQVSEFLELNGLIISGAIQSIKTFEEFATLLDVVVPVITIDIIVAEVSNSKSLSTGIYAGLGSQGAPASSTGSLDNNGISADLSTGTINNIISGLSGLGIVNLGNVSPDFYLRIQAMEADGTVRIETTPSIATLNGHEASVTIGEQEYYLETNSQVFAGSGNPTVSTGQVFKTVSADL